MSGKSSQTKVIALRLPNDIYSILERRVNKSHRAYLTVGQYLKERIIYDTLRIHGNRHKEVEGK